MARETTRPEPGTTSSRAGFERLGYDAFRAGQRESILTLLEERRLLLVAPTGGGKSLVYQLPASLLAGTSLVISPLVSLMQDQVSALEARCVRATFLAATVPAEETRRRLARLHAGAYQIAYVAPERIAYPGFPSLAAELAPPLVAVDEAHCISEWGHDFRPDYLEIGALLAASERTRDREVDAQLAEALGQPGGGARHRDHLFPDASAVLRGFMRCGLVEHGFARLCARRAGRACLPVFMSRKVLLFAGSAAGGDAAPEPPARRASASQSAAPPAGAMRRSTVVPSFSGVGSA